MAKSNKVHELEALLGEYITIQLNDVKMFEKIPEIGAIGITPIVEGYVVDVSETFIYLGSKDPEAFDTLIDHSLINIITLSEPTEEVPQELLQFPEPGEPTH